MMCSSSTGLIAPDPLSESRCPQASGANLPLSWGPITLNVIGTAVRSSIRLTYSYSLWSAMIANRSILMTERIAALWR